MRPSVRNVRTQEASVYRRFCSEKAGRRSRLLDVHGPGGATLQRGKLGQNREGLRNSREGTFVFHFLLISIDVNSQGFPQSVCGNLTF